MNKYIVLLCCALSFAGFAQKKKLLPFHLCQCENGDLGTITHLTHVPDSNGYRKKDTLCIPVPKVIDTIGGKISIGYELPPIPSTHEYILPDGRSLGEGSMKSWTSNIESERAARQKAVGASDALPEQTTAGCTFNGKPMNGKVRAVTTNADFKVRVVERNETLTVRYVTNSLSNTRCGQWEMVSTGEDFTVQFVEWGEDFTIRIAD
jgi:hypothetical protein